MLKQLFQQANRIWQGIWFVFYILILSLSILWPESFILNLVKILSIFGCCIYVCTVFPYDESLIFVMFITFIADGLLAFSDNLFYGVFAFFIAQLLHFYRITGKYKIVMYYGLIALIFIFFGKLEIMNNTIEPMFILCGFYAVAIIANIIASYSWKQTNPKSPHATFAFYGFILFLACDTCVALSYLSTTGILPADLTIFLNFAAWFFYYPSQILVSNSSKCATIE